MKKRLLAILCLTVVVISTMWSLGVKADDSGKKEFPEKYDLRELGLVTPVKDQRPYGMCWAFAITAAMESNALVKGIGEYDLSEYQIGYLIGHTLAPKDTPIHGEGPVPLDSESKWYDFANATGSYSSQLVKGYAIMTEDKFPYENMEKELGAAGISIDGDIYVDSYYAVQKSNSEGIKNLVMEHGAVNAYVNATSWKNESYFNSETNSMYLPLFKENSELYAGIDHSVVIVGWDDNYSKDNFVIKPKADGAWIIKNSWGTEWGEEGYGYLSYYDAAFTQDSSNYAFSISVRNERNYDRIYQYDGGIGYEAHENVAAVAINFTAEERESITGVRIKPYYDQEKDYGYYDPQIEYSLTTATVNVYKGKFDGESEEKSEPLYTQKYALRYTDYQTIEFEKPVDIKKGEDYHVIVSFDSRIAYCVDGEYIGYNYKNVASGRPGETYLKLGGYRGDGKWYDTSLENKPNGVVYRWYEDAENNGVWDAGQVSSSACIKVLTVNRASDSGELFRDWFGKYIGLQGTCVIIAAIAMIAVLIVVKKKPRL